MLRGDTRPRSCAGTHRVRRRDSPTRTIAPWGLPLRWWGPTPRASSTADPTSAGSSSHAPIAVREPRPTRTSRPCAGAQVPRPRRRGPSSRTLPRPMFHVKHFRTNAASPGPERLNVVPGLDALIVAAQRTRARYHVDATWTVTRAAIVHEQVPQQQRLAAGVAALEERRTHPRSGHAHPLGSIRPRQRAPAMGPSSRGRTTTGGRDSRPRRQHPAHVSGAAIPAPAPPALVGATPLPAGLPTSSPPTARRLRERPLAAYHS